MTSQSIEEFALQDLIKQYPDKKELICEYNEKYKKKLDKLFNLATLYKKNKEIQNKQKDKCESLEIEILFLKKLKDIYDTYDNEKIEKILKKYNINLDEYNKNDKNNTSYNKIQHKLKNNEEIIKSIKNIRTLNFDTILNLIEYKLKIIWSHINRENNICLLFLIPEKIVLKNDNTDAIIMFKNNIFDISTKVICYKIYDNYVKLYIFIESIIPCYINSSYSSHSTNFDKYNYKHATVTYEDPVFGVATCVYIKKNNIDLNEIDNHIKKTGFKHCYFNKSALKPIKKLIYLANKFDENSLFYLLPKDILNTICNSIEYEENSD